MADLSVPFVNATEGMAEGNPEVRPVTKAAAASHVDLFKADCATHTPDLFAQELKQLHDPGREGTEVSAEGNCVVFALHCHVAST
jgi:hypothetical protein